MNRLTGRPACCAGRQGQHRRKRASLLFLRFCLTCSCLLHQRPSDLDRGGFFFFLIFLRCCFLPHSLLLAAALALNI